MGVRAGTTGGGRRASGSVTAEACGSGWPSKIVIWQKRRAASSVAHIWVAASEVAIGPITNRKSIPRDLFSRTATIGWRSSNKSAVLLRTEFQSARNPSKVVAPPTSRPKSTIRDLPSGSAASGTLATRVGDAGGAATGGAAGADGAAAIAPGAGAAGVGVALGDVAATGADFSGCAWLRAEGGVGGVPVPVGAGASAGRVEGFGTEAGLAADADACAGGAVGVGTTVGVWTEVWGATPVEAVGAAACCLIEPVTSSRLRSSDAMRATRRSRSAVNPLTASDSWRAALSGSLWRVVS